MSSYIATELRKVIDVQSIVTVHYFEYAKNYVFEGERHDFWELLYVDKGEVEVMADEVGYRLKRGEMIFHKPNEFHNVFANGVVAPNLVVVAFVCPSPAMTYFEGKILKAGEDERELLARLVNEARDAFTTPLDDPGTVRMERASSSAFGSEQMIGMLLEQMLIRLVRRGAEPAYSVKESSSVKKRSDNDLVRRGDRLHGGERGREPDLLSGLPLLRPERHQSKNHLQGGDGAGRDGILPLAENRASQGAAAGGQRQHHPNRGQAGVRVGALLLPLFQAGDRHDAKRIHFVDSVKIIQMGKGRRRASFLTGGLICE